MHFIKIICKVIYCVSFLLEYEKFKMLFDELSFKYIENVKKNTIKINFQIGRQ